MIRVFRSLLFYYADYILKKYYLQIYNFKMNEVKALKRHHSLLGILIFLLANIAVAALYFHFMYVHQDDYATMFDS